MHTHLAALERRHRALKREICAELLHPSWDDLKLAELKRRKLLVKDEIACLRQGHGATIELAAKLKLKSESRIAKLKSSLWYGRAARSIAIINNKPH
jgi:hypothetical protein